MSRKVPQSILGVSRIETAIKKAKDVLLKRARKSGLYENFGQAEVDAIRDKFIDPSDFSNDMLKQRSQLDAFRDWAATLSEDDLAPKQETRISMFS